MKQTIIYTTLILIAAGYLACSPAREFTKIPVYSGNKSITCEQPLFNQVQKTVVIIADNAGTEVFDLIAPFYLFKQTGKANVFIVAKNKYPIAAMKGFFVLPHYTFNELDSLNIEADVIVMPNLSARNKGQQDPFIVAWIRNRHSPATKLLSICAGSFTAAATGLFDGIEMTSHATDLAANIKQYSKPRWVKDLTYTRAGNLYSTGGVSNATAGSLAVIKDVFGEETMKDVMKSIDYPYDSLQTAHKSVSIKTADKLGVVQRIIFKPNPHIGVLLEENIDEFILAAVTDSYHRTFPSSVKTYSLNDGPVRSKFGLTVLPTGAMAEAGMVDELHVLSPNSVTEAGKFAFRQATLVSYKEEDKYIFDRTLSRIREEYGSKTERMTRLLLDYN